MEVRVSTSDAQRILDAVFKTILARLLTLPACPHPVVYYGALITEICKVNHAQFKTMRFPFDIKS